MKKNNIKIINFKELNLEQSVLRYNVIYFVLYNSTLIVLMD